MCIHIYIRISHRRIPGLVPWKYHCQDLCVWDLRDMHETVTSLPNRQCPEQGRFFSIPNIPGSTWCNLAIQCVDLGAEGTGNLVWNSCSHRNRTRTKSEKLA